MKNKLIIISILFCALLLGRNAYAQPGTVDLSFNIGAGFDAEVFTMALQDDGKIIAGGHFTTFNGNSSYGIVRLNADGSMDPTFIVGTGFAGGGTIQSILIQPDGKILVVGDFWQYTGISSNKIARLNVNGSIDNTFNVGSGFDQLTTAIALQPDGKIVVGGMFTTYNGTARSGIARINSDGSIDSTFNPGTGLADNTLYYVSSIIIQPDNKIILAGNFEEYNGIYEDNITRVLPDGTWDASFNQGLGFNEQVNALALQPDQKIIAGGDFTTTNVTTTTNYISRITPVNTFDTSFASGTALSGNGLVRAIQLLPDGKIMIGGNFTHYNTIETRSIARLLEDGTIDTLFNVNYGFDNPVKAFALQPDGKLLVGGFFTTYNGTTQNYLTRLNGENYALFIENINNTTCTGNDGNVAIGVYNGTPPFTYLWNTNPPQTNDTVINLNPGNYTVTVTDNNNQTVTGSINIGGPSTFTNTDLAGHFTTTFFRPNVLSHIFIDVSNQGCFPLNGNAQLILDSDLNYVNATPTPSSISGDTLRWNLSSMTFESPHFTALVNVITDLSAQIGDSVCLELKVLPIEQDGNNLMTMCYPIVNSYDPNDKQVYPQGTTTSGFISNNQKMHYTVRFQNTGNAEAYNIYILDTLDADLNLESLYITATSHSMLTEILPGNVLKFRFDDINLADSTSNEEASHGYVMYEVEQNQDLPVNTEIKNTAYIYFDFNSPVVTNTTLNTIRLSTGIDDISSYPTTLFPNPASTEITIIGYSPAYLKLCNTLGQTILEANKTNKLWLGNLPRGLYLLQLFDEKGSLVKTEKVVKE